MPFLAILKEGGGCDHSIGCGIRTIEVPERIASVEDAAQWLFDNDELDGTNGSKLKSATLYTVEAKSTLDLKTIYATAEQRQKEAKAQQEESAERDMLRKLQEKYGG